MTSTVLIQIHFLRRVALHGESLCLLMPSVSMILMALINSLNPGLWHLIALQYLTTSSKTSNPNLITGLYNASIFHSSQAKFHCHVANNFLHNYCIPFLLNKGVPLTVRNADKTIVYTCTSNPSRHRHFRTVVYA